MIALFMIAVGLGILLCRKSIVDGGFAKRCNFIMNHHAVDCVHGLERNLLYKVLLLTPNLVIIKTRPTWGNQHPKFKLAVLNDGLTQNELKELMVLPEQLDHIAFDVTNEQGWWWTTFSNEFNTIKTKEKEHTKNLNHKYQQQLRDVKSMDRRISQVRMDGSEADERALSLTNQ